MPGSIQSGRGDTSARDQYERSGAAAYGITAEEFGAILKEICRKHRPEASAEETTNFCGSLPLGELALARACAAGNERAWQDFISRYRQRLHAMALHITRDIAHA